MNYFIYVIKSQSTGKIYIGQTRNLTDRIKKHNKRLFAKTTSYPSKNKGPWVLVYKEKFKTRSKAIKREKELKSYKGREYVKRTISGPVAQW